MTYNDWDNRMEQIWSLKDKGHYQKPKMKKDQTTVKWEAPPKDWVKLNFDGACRGNPRASRIGAIIRDEKGSILHRAYGDLGLSTTNKAKVRALEMGLHLCAQNKLSKVIIEGDSQVIINGIIKSKFQNWKLNKWVPLIKKHLQDIGMYEFTHVYRKRNQVVDNLANLGVNLKEGSIIFNHLSIPTGISDQIQNEICVSVREGIR